MRKCLPITWLAAMVCVSLCLQAQQDRFLYAITDIQADGNGWNALRKMDTKTGEISAVLMNGADAGVLAFDAVSKKAYTAPTDARFGNYLQAPFSTGVAAAAYDKKNNRIWYTPMFIDQLRYIDLNTMKAYYVTDQAFTGLGNMHNDEGKIITRMVITPNGEGYAISNDANTFVRFSTKKNIRIENLGSLVDDPANDQVSVHNRCTSFGGDMIADDEGRLYIISSRNHIFVVNTENKVATHKGMIAGLPEQFTANGAVVNEDGKLLLSSAVYTNAWAIVDPEKWSASEFKPAAGVVKSSDLANSNYLHTRKSPPSNDLAADRIAIYDEILAFPNPVTHNRFNLQFAKLGKGDYTIALTDITGRVIQRKQVSIGGENQVEEFVLAENTAKGMYLVNVMDKSDKSLFTQKLIVQ